MRSPAKELVIKIVLICIGLVGLAVVSMLVAQLQEVQRQQSSRAAAWEAYRYNHECRELQRTQFTVRWRCRYGVIIERSVGE